ncbi:hypothetical protein [Streptomyces sp. ASQP_92]|uniref:arsenate reductase/protein-tyrosine-phosphatase family protein n=1 Tax=Streptomyces sp. ASQP_92 TaxID=2979116 RepID=UPI0037DA1F5B
MIKAALARGYDLTSHRPTQLDKALLVWADVVLAMDRSVLGQLHDITGEDNTTKMRLYLDDGQDVPTPWANKYRTSPIAPRSSKQEPCPTCRRARPAAGRRPMDHERC